MTEAPRATPLLSRRHWMGIAAGGVATFAAVFAYRRFGRGSVAEAVLVTLHTRKDCPCCHKWATHLEDNGFRVQTMIMPDVMPVKQRLGVPAELHSCHTAEMEGYVVEGHVPANLMTRFLTERSNERGLAVPGMPGGSPGMESDAKVPYDVLAFRADGTTRVYAHV